MPTKRVNVSLDEHRAAKLARLAERAHVPDGTLARSLLSAAIDDADPDVASITAILEGIPGLQHDWSGQTGTSEQGRWSNSTTWRRRGTDRCHGQRQAGPPRTRSHAPVAT